MVESLGFRTDLMILALHASSIERRDGFRIIRTPRNPSFHWGNFLLLDAAPEPGTIAAWVEVFSREFPGVGHLAIGVDGTDGEAGDGAELAAAALAVERITILTAREFSEPTFPAPVAELRMLGEDDWEAAIRLETIVYPSDDPDSEAFVRGQLVARRELQEKGRGGCFGAFVDGDLVSSLGVFDDGGGVARYQSVETHPDFRGHGLAGALIRTAGNWALSDRANQTLVVAADPDDAAIGLYRSLGFEGTETQVQLSRT